MSNVPVELKYTKDHEWISVLDDGNLMIGITEHAQDLLGDMVFIEAPEAGSKFEPGQACAVRVREGSIRCLLSSSRRSN